MYHNSIATIKKAHEKLFSKRGVTVITERRIGFRQSQLCLIEGCLRVLASDEELKRKAETFFLELATKYDSEESTTFDVKNTYSF